MQPHSPSSLNIQHNEVTAHYITLDVSIRMLKALQPNNTPYSPYNNYMRKANDQKMQALTLFSNLSDDKTMKTEQAMRNQPTLPAFFLAQDLRKRKEVKENTLNHASKKAKI